MEFAAVAGVWALRERKLHGADDAVGGARDEEHARAGGDFGEHAGPKICDYVFRERHHEADRRAALDGVAEKRVQVGAIGGGGWRRKEFDGQMHF